MKRKGIILAGGSATRLYPATQILSKQLLPIFDKPMIYYPLSTLMLADMRDILVISTPRDTPQFQELLGDGSQWGLNLEYAVQASPDGLGQALIIAEKFLNGAPSTLILGDNIFYGHSLEDKLKQANHRQNGATIFAYRVQDPQNFGVVQFNENGQVISLEEKPTEPKSNHAVTGLYFFDEQASELAKQLKPSARGELEITDLNKLYLEQNQLYVEKMNRGFAWLDTGTHESLIEAHQFVRTIEHRQGLKISCLEEIAFKKRWIDKDSLIELAKPMSNSSYGRYLKQLIDEFEDGSF